MLQSHRCNGKTDRQGTFLFFQAPKRYERRICLNLRPFMEHASHAKTQRTSDMPVDQCPTVQSPWFPPAWHMVTISTTNTARRLCGNRDRFASRLFSSFQPTPSANHFASGTNPHTGFPLNRRGAFPAIKRGQPTLLGPLRKHRNRPSSRSAHPSTGREAFATWRHLTTNDR